MNQHEINIYVFGKLTEITGQATLALPVISDTDALMQLLTARYPLLSQTTFIISVNRKIIRQCTTLDNLSEIALLPPFSGG